MNSNFSQIAGAGANIATDFKALAAHADELLQATHAATGSGVEMARTRLTESLKQARERLQNVESQTLTRARQAATSVGTYAQTHPWQMLAIVALAGMLLGMLSRRSAHAS